MDKLKTDGPRRPIFITHFQLDGNIIRLIIKYNGAKFYHYASCENVLGMREVVLRCGGQRMAVGVNMHEVLEELEKRERHG